MINFNQKTVGTTDPKYSMLDIAVSGAGASCSFSHSNGRDFRFAFLDSNSDSLGSIVQEARKDFPGIKIRVFLIDADNTLIPHDLFDYTNEKDYLTYNAPANDVIVSTDSVYSQSLKNVFGIQSGRFSGVSEMEGIKIQHYLSPLMTFLPKKKNEIFMVWLHDHVALIGVRDGNIILSRCLPCHEIDGAFYQTLLCYDTCGFDRNEHPLTMMGRFERTSDLFQLFYRYIKNIELPSVPNIEGGEDHMFFDMYLMSKYI